MSVRYAILAALVALCGAHHLGTAVADGDSNRTYRRAPSLLAKSPTERSPLPVEKPVPVAFGEGYYLCRFEGGPGLSTVVRVQQQEGGAYQLTWAQARPYSGVGILQG